MATSMPLDGASAIFGPSSGSATARCKTTCRQHMRSCKVAIRFEAWFRSRDLRVKGPPSFHCATSNRVQHLIKIPTSTTSCFPPCKRVKRAVQNRCGGSNIEPARGRTWNLRFRRPTPYPLGHKLRSLLAAAAFVTLPQLRILSNFVRMHAYKLIASYCVSRFEKFKCTIHANVTGPLCARVTPQLCGGSKAISSHGSRLVNYGPKLLHMKLRPIVMTLSNS